MRPASLVRPLAAAILVIAAARAAAHNFWIQPSAFRPAAKDLVAFDLRVGLPGESEAFGRHTQRIRRFDATRADAATGGESTTVTIVGRDGYAPAGYARFAEDGLYRVAYESHPVFLELAAQKFESYLVQEGLEHVVLTRAEVGESESAGFELYSRCSISVVAVGAASARDTNYGAPLGLELEILPAVNPTTIEPGGDLAVQLLLRGEPLVGALVNLDVLTVSDVPAQQRRTDAEGRAHFSPSSAGSFLLTAVAMERAPDAVRTREEERADWTSQWASLTFEVAPAAPKPAE